MSAVVKQPIVVATNITDLRNVEDFLRVDGFIKMNSNKQDYRNDELGIILEDLHEMNVLTSRGVLQFIDTVFYITNTFYEE